MKIIIDPNQVSEIIKTNNEFVNDLRQAINSNNISQFFEEFNHKPRYIEILQIVLLFPDGIDLVYKMYNYLLNTLKDKELPEFVSVLADYPTFHELLLRDLSKIYHKIFENPILAGYKLQAFLKGCFKMTNTDEFIISHFSDMMEKVPNLISSFLEMIKDRPYFNDLFLQYYSRWIELSKGQEIIYFIQLLINYDEKEALFYIKNNFDMLINNAGAGNIYAILCTLVKYNKFKQLIQDYFFIIMKHANAYDMVNIMNNLDETLELGIKKSNPLIEVLRNKVSTKEQNHLTFGAIVLSQKNDDLSDFLESLMNQEGVSSFQSIGNNGWSNLVFLIGSKVLKIGWIRNNPNIENHYRIITPEYFEIIKDENNNPILYIEVQRVLSQDGITQLDMNDFFDDITNDDLLYVDPKGSCSDNFAFLSSLDGIASSQISDSFKKRALVLIDRDCIWKKNDPNIKYLSRY